MRYKKLINDIFEKGKNKMDDMEVFIEFSKDAEIDIFEGEIDKYSISETGGLSLRGICDGKMGYSYTEKLDETSIDMLIEDALENGRYIDAQDKEEIFSGSKKYEDIEIYNEKLCDIALEDKIKFIKNLEQEAFKLDERVEVVMCTYVETESEKYLVNTKGLDLKEKKNMAFSYCSVVVKEGEESKTGMSYVISNDFSNFDENNMAKEAVDEAISMLGATSIKSKEYPAIFRNDVFASILGSFTPIFSGENVQKGFSLLKGKVGTQIANSVITLVDDPFLKDGVGTRSFDDEGTATNYKKIIDGGILKVYFHNWKTAKKEKKESTGNAYRGSYKSSISVAPTNLYILEGEKSLESLIDDIDEGVFITDVQGLHSGLDPISGDFSLSAHGYEIKKGKIKRPINQITIAGNFFETLMNIEVLGNDLKFCLPSLGSYIGSPSIKVNKISVSGE